MSEDFRVLLNIIMMTVEDIKRQYGSDSMLLFKGTEPFTEVETGIPQGVVISNGEGRICCYICGDFFERLNTHLRTHELSSREYKVRFGLNLDTALCSREHSRKMAEAGKKSWENDIEGHREKAMMMGRRKIGRPRGVKKSMQEKNRMNTCDEQIKRRMELLVARFGPEVSLRQARESDSGLAMFAFRHFNGWSAFRQSFGLVANTSSEKKEYADLIYALREHASKYGKVPWKRGRRLENFPFSEMPYTRVFGSRKRAYFECGLESGLGGTLTIKYV